MPGTTRRTLAALTLAAAAAAPAACSIDDQGVPISYAPAAYGEVIGGIGHCYYTDNIGEAYLLQAAGLCPSGWAPWPMPTYWHQRYWGYYSSSAWIDRYVPSAQRSYYRTTYVTRYYTVNRAGIAQQSKTAVWRGSNGTTVRGGTGVSFGGGSGRTYSGGTSTGVKDSASRSTTTRRSSSESSFGSSSGRRRP